MFWILDPYNQELIYVQNLEKKTKCVPTLILLHRNLQIIPPAPFPPSSSHVGNWSFVVSRTAGPLLPLHQTPRENARGISGVSGDSFSGWLGKLPPLDDQPVEIDSSRFPPIPFRSPNPSTKNNLNSNNKKKIIQMATSPQFSIPIWSSRPPVQKARQGGLHLLRRWNQRWHPPACLTRGCFMKQEVPKATSRKMVHVSFPLSPPWN